MKRVLITGERSYVGTQLNKWLAQWPEDYEVTMISVRDQQWRQMDFSKFDVIVHAAALVHKKERPSMRDEYFRVNSDLTYDLALKAKQEGVSQFIFLSTISVYGLEGEIGNPVVINRDTLLKPKSYYGMSKLDAENRINQLQDEGFIITILRIPMIYGPFCPGNFDKLIKMTRVLFVFPNFYNERCSIYVDHLCILIKKVIVQPLSGIYLPQNKDQFITVKVVKIIASSMNKEILFSSTLAKLSENLMSNNLLFKKIFGNLIISDDLSLFEYDYSPYSLSESVNKSVKLN